MNLVFEVFEFGSLTVLECCVPELIEPLFLLGCWAISRFHAEGLNQYLLPLRGESQGLERQ